MSSSQQNNISPPERVFAVDLISPMQTPPRVIGHRNTVTPPSSSSRRNTQTDRFIPSRAVTNLDEAFDILENRHQFDKANKNKRGEHPQHDLHMTNMLRSELLGQPPVEISYEASLVDGKLKSPHRRDSSSSLFKYRRSSSGTAGSGSITTLPDDIYDDIGTLGTPSNRRSTSSLAGVSSSRHSSGSAAHHAAGSSSDHSTSRKISRQPYKVLDAPLLQDDYYLNLLDWSQGNTLAVALGASVYLWSAATAKVSRLCDLSVAQTDTANRENENHINELVTSLTWSPLQTHHLAVGTSTGRVLLYDTQATRRLRDDLTAHDSRVGALAWAGNNCLASGSRDRNILLQDTRAAAASSGLSGSASSHNRNRSFSGSHSVSGSEREGMIQSVFASPLQPAPPLLSAVTAASSPPFAAAAGSSSSSFLMTPPRLPHQQQQPFAAAVGAGFTTTTTTAAASSTARCLRGHRQEICGLKWSFDDKLLASGGNDNKLFVWHPSHTTDQPLFQFEDHIAAVKAVAWSPHQGGLLASGGGTADRHIRFWSTATGMPLYKVDTGSQVCNLMWSRTVNEIVSTHGYSLNQVIIWRYPSMTKLATLSGHTMRVLYLSMSPDGTSIVTGAGDETLRFWNVFPPPRNRQGQPLGVSTLTPTTADCR
jgi:WD40 repeat protein